MVCASAIWELAKPSADVLAGTPVQPDRGRDEPAGEELVPEIVPDASAASVTPTARKNGTVSTALARMASRRPLLTGASRRTKSQDGGTAPWRPPGCQCPWR